MVEGALLKRGYMGEIERDVAMDVEGDGATAPAVQEFIKLYHGSGDLDASTLGLSEYVDVPISCLQKQTNTTSNEHAVAMLDLALGVGALTLVTTFDPRLVNKGLSPYRAIPVINTAELFACLSQIKNVSATDAQISVLNPQGGFTTDENGVVVTERYEFEAAAGGGHTITLPVGKKYDGGDLYLTVGVEKQDLAVVRPTWDKPQKNNSLALVGPGTTTSAGLYFKFDVVTEGLPDVLGVVVGYINKASGSSTASKKRKLVSMEEAF